MNVSGSFLAIAFIGFNITLSAQAIDNTASFRIIDAPRYMRLHYENDYFTATDIYYTQGLNFEIVAPSYRKFLLSKLLLATKKGISQSGIAVEHNGYTPTSIKSNEILYGDRPFAAAIMLKSFAMTSDTVHNCRITSSLTLGIIGPAAGGYEMQRSIHRWINGQEPFGWQYQIQNDAIVNYELGIEKNIMSSGNSFLLNGLVNARLGTLNSKASAGFVIMAGRLTNTIVSIFSKEKCVSKRKVFFHLYVQPLINMVGNDATLQGGLFNTQSPYTISSPEITRVTYQVNYGGILSFGSIQLDYFKTAISREFETGGTHRWGGIRVGVKF